MLDHLIDLVMAIWNADSEMCDNSLVGESEMDRKSRGCVSIVCGGLIALLLLAGIIAGAFWWWAGRR